MKKNSLKIIKLGKSLFNYEKKVLAKNSSGVITDYNLYVSSVFLINFNDKNKT